jgi:hypothetical protein
VSWFPSKSETDWLAYFLEDSNEEEKSDGDMGKARKMASLAIEVDEDGRPILPSPDEDGGGKWCFM